LLYETLKANLLNKAKVDDTGGNALLASGGMEINFSKMAVGFNAQLPITQNFSNEQTTTKVRGMAHVTFYILKCVFTKACYLNLFSLADMSSSRAF
jgi:hypothetical protein